jgi:enoyl-CoA hydratase
LSYRHLDVERRGDIVTCTISNPPTHTLTARGVVELQRLVDELSRDDSVRVLVFTGAGDEVFIRHYEVGELADASEQAGDAAAPPEPDDGPRLHPMNRLCLSLEAQRFITVAAINGSTAGGGLELCLACDFRLAREGPFVLGLPETTVGILPGAGGTQRLTRLLGTARALDLILHGRLLSPSEALDLGVVHRVYSSEAFDADVRAFAEDLAGRAPIALAAAKRAIQGAHDRSLPEGLAFEQEAFAETLRSEDAAGAMRAMLEGKTWQWKGK